MFNWLKTVFSDSAIPDSKEVSKKLYGSKISYLNSVKADLTRTLNRRIKNGSQELITKNLYNDSMIYQNDENNELIKEIILQPFRDKGYRVDYLYNEITCTYTVIIYLV